LFFGSDNLFLRVFLVPFEWNCEEIKLIDMANGLIKNYLYKGIIILGTTCMVLSSCSTEIDINAPNQNVPIVYCILNDADSVQYVRLQKTYLVDQAAISTPPEADSLYFPGEIQISLERWENGRPVQTVQFEPTYDVPKDSGFFPVEKHMVYKAHVKILPMKTYYLYVYIKDKEEVLFAETTTLGHMTVTDPLDLKQRKIALNIGENYICRWQPVENAGIYQIGIRLNYFETVDGVTVAKSLDMPQSFTSPVTNIDYLTRVISGSRFIHIISEQLKPIPGVVREVQNLDFYFITGGKEIKYYIESTAPSEGALIEKPVYSNFNNGLGLFSSSARADIKGLYLANTTLDSIAYSQLTNNLGFLDHNGDRDSSNICSNQ